MKLFGKLFLFKKKEKTEPTPVTPVNKTRYGTLMIPELHINVPLYSSENGNAQRIVDDSDSAVHISWPGGREVIADHASQANFSNLKDVRPNCTIAVLETKEHQNVYICSKYQIGHIITENGKNSLRDADMNLVYTQNQNALTVYTCLSKAAADDMRCHLTYWNLLLRVRKGCDHVAEIMEAVD